MGASDKPAVLIIGGLGYIGRFLALHIHRKELASEIRLVDKVLPELAFLPEEFKEACSRDKFMQADASREQSLAKIFTRDEDKGEFDYVFNCGGESRYNQEDEVYKARCHALSLNLGKECARRKIQAMVECSTGLVYKPGKTPRKETDSTKPWLKLAKWKLSAEEELAAMESLNLVILRMANVYGPYTSKFLGTALCMARVYQELEKEMKWLWDADLKTNTVHVEDVARALWKAATWYVTKGKGKRLKPVPMFNIVDRGATSQGTMAKLIHKHFAIETGFSGPLTALLTKLTLEDAVEDVNEETLDTWADLLKNANITQPGPITPYLDRELLKDADLSMDGTAFEKATGFEYQHEKLRLKEIEAVIESYQKMGWWP